MAERVDEPELERWIAAFRGPLVGLFASWGRDWRTAEELAQDTFAEAWLSRARFVGDARELDAVGAWLRGVAFRLNAATARRDRVRRAAPLDEVELSAPVAEEDERRALLVAAFARLDAPHQTVLRMHYLESTGAREVASLLGTTPKAVEDRLYQARRALRAEVARLERRAAQGARR
jgi:RNA polymerase sigma factor (sigma-70 family)